MRKYAHITFVSGLVGLATAAALALSAAPAGATLVCPPGQHPPNAYCSNVSPIATTSPASAITSTSATLNGVVGAGVPNGDPTSYQFVLGATSCVAPYLETTTPGTVPSGPSASSSVSAPITGLTPNTTYHYCVVATNADGSTAGNEMTFTTLGPGVTEPIERVFVPNFVRKHKHHTHFNVSIFLRVPAATLIQVEKKDGTVIQSVTRNLPPGHSKVTFPIPSPPGRYIIKFQAAGGNTTQTQTRRFTVRS